MMSAMSSQRRDIVRINAVLSLLRPSKIIFAWVQVFWACMSLLGFARKARISLAAIAKLRSSAPGVPNEFTPTIFPSSVRSGPPELPGLIGVCVWMTVAMCLLSLGPPDHSKSGRNALTIPLVKVHASPLGCPMAATSVPTSMLSSAEISNGRRDGIDAGRRSAKSR